MIGPVFFLAFVAPFVAAQLQYPTTRTPTPYTTEPAYPPSYPSKQEYNTKRPTDYQPSRTPSTYQPSNPPPNYKPSYGNSAPNKGYPQGSSGNGQYNAQNDLYSHYPNSPIRNIPAQLDNAAARIATLVRTDKIYNRNLDIIEAKINESTTYREKFEGTIYPQLLASIDAQDKKIAQYRAQLRNLNDLCRQVRELIDEVDSLRRVLTVIRTFQANLYFTIDKLEVSNGAENLAIVTVEDQTDGNDQLLDIINSTYASNVARYANNVRNLKEVVAIVNEEQGEMVTVELTAQNSSVRVEYEQAFTSEPQLAYSITGITIDDTQDDYKVDETIYPRVTAQGDAKGVTVTLVDKSVGFETKRVRVRLLAFTTNNERSSQGNSTTKPYDAYKTSPQGYYPTTTKAYGNDGASKTSTQGATATTKAYGQDGASKTSSQGATATTKAYGQDGASKTSSQGATATTKAYGQDGASKTSSQGATPTTKAYGQDGASKTSSQGATATTKAYGQDGASKTSTQGATPTTKAYGNDGAYETSSQGATASTEAYGNDGAYETSSQGATASTEAYVEA